MGHMVSQNQNVKSQVASVWSNMARRVQGIQVTCLDSHMADFPEGSAEPPSVRVVWKPRDKAQVLICVNSLDQVLSSGREEKFMLIIRQKRLHLCPVYLKSLLNQ